MFRSRFTDAFPPKLCPHFGPQDIERGIVDPLPASQIESLLCTLLGLVLNRKKPVEFVTLLSSSESLRWGLARTQIMASNVHRR